MVVGNYSNKLWVLHVFVALPTQTRDGWSKIKNWKSLQIISVTTYVLTVLSAGISISFFIKKEWLIGVILLIIAIFLMYVGDRTGEESELAKPPRGQDDQL